MALTRVIFESYFSMDLEEDTLSIIERFRNSDQGKWLSEKGISVQWVTHDKVDIYSWTESIVGDLPDDLHLEWVLRWK